MASSVYVSTACLSGEEPILSRINLYRSYGLNSIELGAGVSVDKKSLSQIFEIDANFLVHNYFPPPVEPFVLNLASSDPQTRKRSQDFVRYALKISKDLGAPFYSVHAGFITDPIARGKTSFIFPSPESTDAAKNAFSRYIESIGHLLEYAEDLGVKLLIENNVCSQELEGKLLFTTSDEYQQMFNSIRSQQLGVLLDTGHLNVTARTLQFDRDFFIDQILPFVRAFHVHDNNGLEDSHYPVLKESWIIDVLRNPLLKSWPIIIEAKFGSVEELSRHVKWILKELGRD
jgi:sugar phosphate isomerase/epimerase